MHDVDVCSYRLKPMTVMLVRCPLSTLSSGTSHSGSCKYIYIYIYIYTYYLVIMVIQNNNHILHQGPAESAGAAACPGRRGLGEAGELRLEVLSSLLDSFYSKGFPLYSKGFPYIVRDVLIW